MADANTGGTYAITKGIADDKELEKYRRCFEDNGSPRQLDNLQWLHQKNLTGLHAIYYALYEQQVAAIYTAMPVVFTVDGEVVNAMQSIDTMTDINHRGKGLFPKLANKLYADAEAGNQYDLVYGFPNENSASGFFNKLKWISFGEAPFLIKPLRVSYFINKVLDKKKVETDVDTIHNYSLSNATALNKTSKIKILENFGEEYDKVWEVVSGKIKVGINRNAAYMNWRYVNKPGEEYSKCGLYIHGSLAGVVIFTIKNKHKGRIGYIMELVYDANAQQNAGELLLQFARTIFKREKTDTVLAWCFSHSFNFNAFKNSGYFHLPVKFRPQHLFLGVRAFNEKRKAIIEDVKNWYVSYSDSDTV